MPRDITHWLIAADTAALLPADTFYGEAARARPAACALGAVLHDALFYAPADAAPFGWVADRLHGEGGEDTFAPVRGLHRAVRELRAAGSPLARDVGALQVGFVAHLHADVTLHPFVYYHSGLPAPSGRLPTRASQGHRRLEALIDLHFVGELDALDRWSLGHYLDAAGARVRDLLWVAARALVDPAAQPALVATLRASFERYAFAQAIFRRRSLGWVAWALRRLLPDGAREVGALVYAPVLVELLPRVAGEVDYRHPVTGAALCASLAALRQRAAAAAAATCARLEATPRRAEPLAGEVGPSLVAGLPGVGAAALVHRAAEPLVPL